MLKIAFYGCAAILGMLIGLMLSNCSSQPVGCTQKVFDTMAVECGEEYRRFFVDGGFICCPTSLPD